MAFKHVEPPCIFLVWSVNVVDFCALFGGFSFLLLYKFLQVFSMIRTLLEAKDQQKQGNLWMPDDVDSASGHDGEN